MPPREFAGHDWRDTPAAPLDVVDWLDRRDCQVHHMCVHLLPSSSPQLPRLTIMRTHRLSGPPDLDADIAASDVELRQCFREHAMNGAPIPRVRVTFVPRHGAPAIVGALEPDAIASGLQRCIRDVLGDIRASTTAPVIVVAGAP